MKIDHDFKDDSSSFLFLLQKATTPYFDYDVLYVVRTFNAHHDESSTNSNVNLHIGSTM